MTISSSKTTSAAVLSPNGPMVSKTTWAVVLSPKTMVSKTTVSVVLNMVSETVSKTTANVVLVPNAAMVSKVTTNVVLYRSPYVRSSKLTAQAVLNKPTPTPPTFRIQFPRTFAEVVTGNANLEFRVPRTFVEALTGDANLQLRCPRVFLEVLCDIPEEPFMLDPNTQLLPLASLQGLTMEVTKAPTFSTKVGGIVSGREVRNALYDDPRWEITISFDYLPDKSTGANYVTYKGTTQLKILEGFFMQCRGSYQSFLYKDQDDYQTTSVFGDGDGGTSIFYIRRDLGGFKERIGQLNTAETYNFWKCPTSGESKSVPASGPYTVTVNNSASFVTDVKVTNSTGTIIYERVTGTPGTYQYSVAAGVYTFNAAQAGQAVKIYYGYAMTQGVDYNITMPNKIVLTSVLPVGTSVGGTFQFYYVCRFSEDMAEFDKFMDKLWELQQLSFRSVIQ